MELVSFNPATGKDIGRVAASDPGDIQRKVDALRARLPAADLRTRIGWVRSAAEKIRENVDNLSRLMTEEQGKPLKESKGEVANSAVRLDYFCETAPAALAPVETDLGNALSVTRFQPIGVIGAIKPWNFPVTIPLWTIGPAILAGNAILFKPSERTPLLGDAVANLFPDALLETVHGTEEVGKAIVDSDVDMISFVGSRAVGASIMRRSADKIRPLTLELGGKDPMIVCADADIDAAVEGAVTGTFRNSGQVCCGIERIYVEKGIFDSFLEKAVEKTRSLKVGNGLEPGVDMGPMNREEQVATVERHLADAKSRGARILTGGSRREGLFFDPTIITELSNEMVITREETFGPVMNVTRVEDVDEAVARANETRFGLTATVWSGDPEKADRIAQRLQAGTIAINQFVGSLAECPWGGVKASGIGRMLGPDAVREFTTTVNYRYPR